MTLIVGLVARRGAVVGADGRRFGINGDIESDSASKAYRCADAPFIYGIAGQLAPGGVEMSEIVANAVRSTGRDGVTKAIENVKVAVEEQLMAVGEHQVAFAMRIVEVVLIGCEAGKMRGVHIRVEPDGPAPRLRSTISWAEIGYVAMAGDPSGQAAARARIEQLPESVTEWKLSHLEDYARTLIRVGIDAAGEHPYFPGRISCGGKSRIVRLEKNSAC